MTLGIKPLYHGAQRHYAKFNYYQCRYAQFYYAECNFAECHYAKCHYAQRRYAECHYSEFHYAQRRYVVMLIFVVLTILLSSSYFTLMSSHGWYTKNVVH